MKLYVVEIVEPIKMSVGIFGERSNAVKYAELQAGNCEISEYDLDEPHPPMNVVYVPSKYYAEWAKKQHVTEVNKLID